jgi:hypothetical protein
MENLLTYNKNLSPQEIYELIKKNNYEGLRIFSQLDINDQLITDFNFLNDLPFLEGLSIASRVDPDYSFLKNLKRLKYLNIMNEGSSTIDLSAQTELEDISLQWRKSIMNIEACVKLKSIGLIDWKEKNMNWFSHLQQLEEVVIKGGTIESIKELKGLNKIQRIVLGALRKLRDIDVLKELTSLKEIQFLSCPNIYNFDVLRYTHELETIRIVDCKTVRSIHFVVELHKLKKIALLGRTFVEDKDLRPIRNVPEKFFSPSKEYIV